MLYSILKTSKEYFSVTLHFSVWCSECKPICLHSYLGSKSVQWLEKAISKSAFYAKIQPIRL